MDERIESALRLLDSHKRASQAYYERLRQIKKDEGTYKKAGRPKKVVKVVLVPEAV